VAPVLDTSFDDILGNSVAKRVLLISAAGFHHVLLSGPPGTGKTLLAKSLASLLPPLSKDKAIEVTKIYSYAGKLSEGVGLIEIPPFRSPHHTSSSSAILGGGAYAMPGEVTFAHNGVLFLDELCEFKRDVIEALRQPLQDGHVSIIRGKTLVEYPADFLFIAATNPCPCGYFNDPEKQCSCSPNRINMYKAKLSGPIADRIDLHVNVFREKNINNVVSDTNTSIINLREKIIRVHEIQQQRYQANSSKMSHTYLGFNAKISAKYINDNNWLSYKTKSFMENAYIKMHLSLRAYFKTIRVARTIADLDESLEINISHLSEALLYRGIG
jgi:magnesium chelatase family protein